MVGKGKSLNIWRTGLLGTGVFFMGGIAFGVTDWAAGKFIDRYQPKLEKRLSKTS